MEDLLRSSKKRAHLLEPLPTIFPTIERLGVNLYPSSFVMVASGPNRGKSLLALTLAIRSGMRVLYLSPDTDIVDMLYRSAAMVSGDTLSDVEDEWLNDAGGYYEDLLRYEVSDRIRFVWDSMTVDNVTDEVKAFGMVYGAYPDIIVVDNINNVYAADTRGENVEKVSIYLQDLAHTTGSLVIGLHHLVGKYANGIDSPPLDSIQEKADKHPDMIWTLWGPPAKDTLFVNIVKNRRGPSDPSGGLRAELAVDYSRADIK